MGNGKESRREIGHDNIRRESIDRNKNIILPNEWGI
jgi:hypothetical protein